MIDPPSSPAPTAPAAPAPAGGAPGKGFDITILKQFLFIVVRRIWLVAICFVVALSFSLISTIKQVPVYRCQATMLLSRESRRIPDQLMQNEDQYWGDYVVTQEELLRSRVIAQKARELMSGPADQLGGNIQKVSVGSSWRGSLVSIVVDSLDPVVGADYANALADAYLDFKAEQRMDTSQSSVISLTQQANRLLDEYRKAEDRVVAFERDHNVLAISQIGNVAAGNLASLAVEAASLRTERMLLEYQQPLLVSARPDVVLATLSPAQSPSIVTPRTIAELPVEGEAQAQPQEAGTQIIERGFVAQPDWIAAKRQQAVMQAELTELRTRFKEAHPRVQEVMRNLKDVERDLNVEVEFALKDFANRLEALRLREEAAKRVEREWEEEALEINRKSNEYLNLKRQADRLRNLYDLVFNRLKEIDISVGIEPESIRIFERALPAAGPMAGRKVQTVVLGGLVGIALGLGLVLGLEFIDDSIRYPEEVTRGLGLAFFGLVPAANWDPDDLRTHLLSNIDQKSSLAEAYRNIRSSLLFSGGKDEVRTLAVTSAVPLEGKTTTCLNLAVCLAQGGSRVLLVDADLRRGELHKYFGAEGGRGLSDVLVGQAKPESVIQRTGLPSLDLVATGPFPPNPAELVLRPELKAFISHALRSYDRILFDCPPVMAVSEASIFASLLDGVICVVWAGHTSRRIAGSAVQLLRDRGARIIGCVLNNLEFGRTGYYYYSGYYGYYDYGHEGASSPGGAKSAKGA